jgi:dGTPase
VARHSLKTPEDVRLCGEPLVAFSAQMREKNRVLQSFLSARVYRHERIEGIMGRARRVVRDLFEAYMNDPGLLPAGWAEEEVRAGASLARQVCDFIAGMTDRYALERHKRLFDLDPQFL